MKLISFEGIEGVGKSTQITLIQEWLKTKGLSSKLIREPGSTEFGEKIRDLLSNGSEKIRVGIKPDGKVIARENTKIFSSDNNEILLKLFNNFITTPSNWLSVIKVFEPPPRIKIFSLNHNLILNFH